MTSLRLRAVVVGGVVLVAGLALAAPSSGHATVNITSPGSGEQLSSSNSTVAAQVTPGEHDPLGTTSVTRVDMVLEQIDSGREPITATTAPASNGTVAFPVHLPYNGKYKVSVTAVWTHPDVVALETGEPDGKQTAGPHQFAVAAPPAVPSGVTTEVDPNSRVVTVTWKANPEPDMLFYVVQRAAGASTEFVPVSGKVVHPETKFVDAGTSAAGGEYRYQVVAVRKGVEKDEGINSDPSAPSAASTATVPAPPGGASTTADPGATGTTPAAGGATPGSTLPANSPGALTTSGKVDLKGFTSVQSQARRTPRTVPPPDTGFQSTLPFAPGSAAEEEPDEGELGEVAADAEQFRELGSTEEGADRQQTMAFFAGGLLATVVLMHLLWVRREVAREPLEPVAPEGPGPVARWGDQQPQAGEWFVPGRLGEDQPPPTVPQDLGRRQKVSSGS